jgi:signal transduction histidine kinase/DNA-binding NarL/FixJ family response regulator/HPt (histidine-containing phosphotransfer) domain-containing protein
MTRGKVSAGLDPEELAAVFPFHVAIDEELRVVQYGVALTKLEPALALGAPLAAFLRFEALPQVDFATLLQSTNNLVTCRSLASGAMLRGQLVWHRATNLLLFLCSPWLTSTDELHRHGLLLSDFPKHDPMADLLQVLQVQETTLADVRKLVAKLSAQRKELRAASVRMANLYEITRVLAGGSCLADIADRLLQKLAELSSCPVVAVWLRETGEQHAYSAGDGQLRDALLRHPPQLADESARLEAGGRVFRLHPSAAGAAAGPVAGPGEGASERPVEPSSPLEPRWAAAQELGFTFAYQLQLEISSGVIGAVEVYGFTAPTHERALLETLAEVALRLANYLEKTRADAALRESIKVAAAAGAAKSQFLARMSHEIRTPINGVLGMIDLVLGTELTERQRSQLETAQSSGELLLGLVNDVLDFSKIEAGFLEVDHGVFDLRACLQRAYQLFESRAAAKKLTYTLVIDPAIPAAALGDELRLSQVLVNLLGNAMKFTRSGGIALEVRALDETEDETRIQISVHDTGIGIPAERRDAIFSSFTQAESSTAREFGGTGLGLAITKQLVELMGGKIQVLSEVGKGSEFRFHVRLGRASAAVLEASPVAAQPLRSLHILVVEDNEINQVVVRGLLERDGHVVEIADRAELAVARGCAGGFDAILMDIQLPDGDGLSATSTIRAHARPSSTRIPIIGLSAQAVAGDRERALGAGMDEYLTKPIRPAQLGEALQRLCGGGDSRAARLRPGRRSAAAGGVGVASSSTSASAAAEWFSEDQQGLFEKVEEYADLGDMIVTLASTLASDAAQRLLELEERLGAGDLPRVAFLAHGLAGSSGTVGCRSIERAARALEQSSRGKPEVDPALQQSLHQDLESLRLGFRSLIHLVGSDLFAALRQRPATPSSPSAR